MFGNPVARASRTRCASSLAVLFGLLFWSTSGQSNNTITVKTAQEFLDAVLNWQLAVTAIPGESDDFTVLLDPPGGVISLRNVNLPETYRTLTNGRLRVAGITQHTVLDMMGLSNVFGRLRGKFRACAMRDIMDMKLHSIIKWIEVCIYVAERFNSYLTQQYLNECTSVLHNVLESSSSQHFIAHLTSSSPASGTSQCGLDNASHSVMAL